MKNFLGVVTVLALISSGCTRVAVDIDDAIEKYDAAADKVELGASKEKALAVLLPTQQGIPQRAKKPAEAFIKDGSKIEIYYFRSGRQPDGLTTDDEFTPYVFTDGMLTGIGWEVLGGPRSFGQTRPTGTSVHVEQPTPKLGCSTIYSSTRGYHKLVGCD